MSSFTIKLEFQEPSQKDEVQFFRCSCCKRNLAPSNFWAQQHPTRPVTFICKECGTEKRRQYADRRVERVMAQWDGCALCGEKKKCRDGLPCAGCLANAGAKMCRSCQELRLPEQFRGKSQTCTICRPPKDLKIKQAEEEKYCECCVCKDKKATKQNPVCAGCLVVRKLAERFPASILAGALSIQRSKAPELPPNDENK